METLWNLTDDIDALEKAWNSFAGQDRSSAPPTTEVAQQQYPEYDILFEEVDDDSSAKHIQKSISQLWEARQDIANRGNSNEILDYLTSREKLTTVNAKHLIQNVCLCDEFLPREIRQYLTTHSKKIKDQWYLWTRSTTLENMKKNSQNAGRSDNELKEMYENNMLKDKENEKEKLKS